MINEKGIIISLFKKNPNKTAKNGKSQKKIQSHSLFLSLKVI